MDTDCCGDSGELQAFPCMLHPPELECLQSRWSHLVAGLQGKIERAPCR